MSELFKREDYLSDKEKASQVFTESFRNMTDEVDRVASEEVTMWGLFVSWIYEKIFGNEDHVKEKQSTIDMHRSAKAFKKIEEIFETEPSNSMNNNQILDHAEKKFKP